MVRMISASSISLGGPPEGIAAELAARAVHEATFFQVEQDLFEELARHARRIRDFRDLRLSSWLQFCERGQGT